MVGTLLYATSHYTNACFTPVSMPLCTQLLPFLCLLIHLVLKVTFSYFNDHFTNRHFIPSLHSQTHPFPPKCQPFLTTQLLIIKRLLFSFFKKNFTQSSFAIFIYFTFLLQSLYLIFSHNPLEHFFPGLE